MFHDDASGVEDITNVPLLALQFDPMTPAVMLFTTIHDLLSLIGLTERREDAMAALVRRHLCRLPANCIQQRLILELVDLHVQRAAAFDHLLGAIAAKSPSRQVATWACA